MSTQSPKNILIAPLDWGLGHTTRCVPLIRYIRSLGHRVIVAGNSWQRSYISNTFDDIDMLPLEGYNVTYSKWNKWAQAGLIAQLPGLYKTIGAEHSWLLIKAQELQLHGIISDNRYGLHHPTLPSVIMTHQLQVQTGMGRLADRMLQKVHYKHLNNFNNTWVVDALTASGLGGILSHTWPLPRGCAYVGLLSQFEGAEQRDNNDGSLLILLSGPEPQRSNLERILWQQAVQYTDRKITFVAGSSSDTPPAPVPAHITYHNWLAGTTLKPLLRSADIVLCRSGYSTLMDLVALGKKAILIPTPGQTEQEYLGWQLHEQGVFYRAKQSGFDLAGAMKEAESFPYRPLELRDQYSVYKEVLSSWINNL